MQQMSNHGFPMGALGKVLAFLVGVTHSIGLIVMDLATCKCYLTTINVGPTTLSKAEKASLLPYFPWGQWDLGQRQVAALTYCAQQAQTAVE